MNYREIEIMHYLNVLKEDSFCLDKQVACAIVDQNDKILAQGVNEIIACDKNCHDKANRTCEVMHAEVVACSRLPMKRTTNEKLTMYVNLFPCVPCQEEARSHSIVEIVVFGPQHKDQVFENIRLEPNFYADLLNSNGQNKQLSVAQGELAELITAISDFFYRVDKGMHVEELADEIVDVELMIQQVKLVAWKKDPELYNWIRDIRRSKYDLLMKKLSKGVI